MEGLLKEISDVFCTVLSCEDDNPFLPEDVKALLDGDVHESYRKDMIGYPHQPFYVELSHSFYNWITTGCCPCQKLSNCELLDDSIHRKERQEIMSQIWMKLSQVKTLWSTWSKDEKHSRWRDILKTSGKRGLLDLLGIRKTLGSVEDWPPARKRLIDTFCELNKEKSKLTVGARALSKHAHRDESSSWWGVCKGSEEAKNDHALMVVNKILDESTWINIHQLPGKVPVLEVRHKDGYGARWSGDGSSFRGFLEPQMEEGWTVGWRH